MKKNVPATMALFSLMALPLMQGCKKADNGVFQVRFYTTKAQGSRQLFVDNAPKGTLTYFAEPPQCGQGYSDGPKPIVLELKAGRYTITGKDDQGRITTAGVIGISSSRMSTTGGTGGLRMDADGSCVVVGLLE